MSQPVDRRAFLTGAGGLALNACAAQALPRLQIPPYQEASATGGGAEGILAMSRAVGPPLPAAGFVADIHCHTFNARDLPIDGFIRSLAQGFGMPAALDPLIAPVTRAFHTAVVQATPKDGVVNSELDERIARFGVPGLSVEGATAQLQAVLGERLGEPGKVLGRFVKTLATVTRTRDAIADSLFNAYQDQRVELYTPALVDFGYFINRAKHGEVLDAYVPPVQQIDLHAQVSERFIKSDRPVAFHPYVAFNPWRQVLEYSKIEKDDRLFDLSHIQRAVNELGFVGVKLYPPCGFLPLGNDRLSDYAGGSLGRDLDAALEALYTWAQKEGVPILTHASTGNAFFKDSSWRSSPWGWRRVLDKYPKLRVCFGHFGGLIGVDGVADALSCVAWAEGFLGLMVDYENVYADFSDTTAASADPAERVNYQSRFLYWLCGRLAGKNGERLASRLMYGSDWWMGMFIGIDEEYFHRIREMVETEMAPVHGLTAAKTFGENLWGANALRFLGICGDDGKLKDDGTAARLIGRYQALKKPPPRWLRRAT